MLSSHVSVVPVFSFNSLLASEKRVKEVTKESKKICRDEIFFRIYGIHPPRQKGCKIVPLFPGEVKAKGAISKVMIDLIERGYWECWSGIRTKNKVYVKVKEYESE